MRKRKVNVESLWRFVFIITVLMPGTFAHGLEKDQQLLMDLQRDLMPDRLDTLLAGEREVALLINESTTPITRGVAVLLGETGHSPLGYKNLAPLAELLNGYGWVTMIMTPPTTGFFNYQPVAATAVAEPTASPAAETQSQADTPIHPKTGLQSFSQEDFSRHEQQLMLQLQAVVERTRQYPGFFLIIAQGTTAAWLTKLYSEKDLELPDAMVVVSPFWPDRNYNNQIPELLAKTEFPVLDIYSPWDNEWSLETSEKRKIAAVKGLKLHYRQRELIGQALNTEQYHLLSKEIYGWLTYMGW